MSIYPIDRIMRSIIGSVLTPVGMKTSRYAIHLHWHFISSCHCRLKHEEKIQRNSGGTYNITFPMPIKVAREPLKSIQ